MNWGFFGPKMAVSWRITFFQKIGWNPYFYSVSGCAFSGPRCQKRQFWDTLSKKRKFWLITEKLFFCYFCVFYFFFLGFSFFGFFFVVFFVFFGGFKGQVRWPKGPPHLALNPPYFLFLFFLFFLFCFFLEGLRVRWGGPKGHLTWP